MKKIVGFYFTFIILLVVSHARFALNQGNFQVSFLDIGQGDSIYIRTPNNCRILIDSGKPNTLGDSLIKILPFNTSQIDLIIITHPDIDHYGGFTSLTSKYSYTNVLISPFIKNNRSYQTLIDNLNKNDSKIQIIQNHMVANYCRLQFNFTSFLEDNANDSSIVTHIQFPNGVNLLASGDISIEQEEYLIDSNFPIQADIFKANHHGSKSSNKLVFLQKIKPDYMVIQSGLNNSFGHPHFKVIKAANQINTTILRNDLSGQIDFFFSGSKKQNQQNLRLKLEK